MKLIISGMERPKANGTTNKENIVPKKKTLIPVKIKADPKVQQVKKKSESPAGFKSLQFALNQLNLTELRDQLASARLQFNNDVINLKTALTFFNEKLRLERAEDSLFFDKPLDYPHIILPDGLKIIVKQLVRKCSEENLKYFFHNILQSLCEDLNKSRTFIGHLIMLQQIAMHFPQVCVANLASTVILRNSYQNQPSICLSLFWALGSSGLIDTTIGLKVWKEIIASVVNVKSYTKFAYDYLHKILSISDRTPQLTISIDEYKALVDLLLSNSDQKAKLKDLQKIKAKCVEMLTSKFVKSCDAEAIEPLFLMLLNNTRRSPEMFVQGVVEAVKAHPNECLKVWKLNFDNISRPNIFIFNFLGESNEN